MQYMIRRPNAWTGRGKNSFLDRIIQTIAICAENKCKHTAFSQKSSTLVALYTTLLCRYRNFHQRLTELGTILMSAISMVGSKWTRPAVTYKTLANDTAFVVGHIIFDWQLSISYALSVAHDVFSRDCTPQWTVHVSLLTILIFSNMLECAERGLNGFFTYVPSGFSKIWKNYTPYIFILCPWFHNLRMVRRTCNISVVLSGPESGS